MIVISKGDGFVAIAGHAGYAEHGKDIVCAAISTLTQVFVESVDKLTDDIIQSDMRAGNALVQYGKNLSERGQVLLDSFFVGLEMIAQTYPQYVYIDQAVKS